MRRSRTESTSSLRTTATMRDHADALALPLHRHAASPSPVPSSDTNASSSEAAPACAISSARRALGDDASGAEDHDAVAQRRHFLHHVRREQHALAGARASPRSCSRSARTLMMSRPLVGSSSMHHRRIVDERAARSRPSSARPARSPARAGRRARSGRASRSAHRARRRARAPARPCSVAVVADVLARGEARIEAARVGQHADPLAHRVAVAHDVEARRRCAVPPSGTISVASMRSSVVLPAPLGPSRPVIWPSGATNDTSRTACTSPLLAERLDEAFDADHGRGARRSGHGSGGTLFSKCATHASGSLATPPSSTNAATRRGPHACGETMWP